MAVMGLKINSPSNGFEVKTGLGADFAKALFGDADMEIKYRRLQSDLVNDEYYRRAQAAAEALTNAKTADQLYRTGAAQGAEGPASQYLQDAMGNPLNQAATNTEQPVIVTNPDAVPIPAPRPDMGFGPDTYGSSELPPIIAGQARSQAQESPGNPPLEPDLRLTTFPRVSDFTLPSSAPVPTRRPGEFPDMPAPIGEPDYGPSLTEAVPFNIDQLLQTPPQIQPEPQVPFNPLQGQPNIEAPHGPGPLFTNRPPLPAPDLRYSNDIGLTDIINYLTGAETPENLRPEPLQPEPPTAWDPGYPIQENMLDAPAAPPWNPRGAPGVENTLELPQPVPVTPFDAGMPIDENTLDYVPEPSHPFPVPIQPYEAPPRPEGAVTEIPGRGRVSPDGPFPPNLGGLDAGVPASVPPNVPPERIPGKPVQGPPVPLPETPDVATGETDVRGPTPAPKEIILHNKEGKAVARMDEEGTRALAAAIIANGGDVAGGLNKLAGGLGVTYGDIHDNDKMRLNAMLATGNLPSTSTMLTSEDKLATEHDIAVAKAAPQSLSSKYLTGGKVIYMASPDPNAAPGTLVAAPGQVDTSGELPGTDQYSSNYNNLLRINKMLDQGLVPDLNDQRSYNASWDFLNNPETTVSQLNSGEQQALTKYKLRPSNLFRDPQHLTPGPVQPPAETPATTPDTQSPAEKIAADQPVVPGKKAQVTAVRGPKKGQAVDVKNNGGWTEAGNKPPSKTETIEGTPGVPKMVTTTFGDPKKKEVSDSAMKGAAHMMESIPAAAILDQYGPGGKEMPGFLQNALDEWSRTGIDQALINKIVDPETREYASAILTFINAPKRTESGAAVNPGEVADYKFRYAMPAGTNDPQDYIRARKNRLQYLKGARTVLTSEQSSTTLQAIDEELAKNGLDFDWEPPANPKEKKRLKPDPQSGELK